MFEAFRSRITRGYVVLAIAIIVLIVGASSALAFLLFSNSLGDGIAAAAARAADAARTLTAHQSIERAAPRIVAAVGRSRFHVAVIDSHGHVLAQNEREGEPSAGRALVITLGRAIGLPRARVPIPGGTILIAADVDRFGALLLWYWSVMVPVGVIGIVIAWLAGRRITARAIGPLIQVTQALGVIASGEFSPQPLPAASSDLQELTNAYNEVAYRLVSATAERDRTEAQMRQFIADAGHELRTPLTIIIGYLDALRKGIVQGSQGTQHTYDTMLDESRKMRGLIEKLILLARLERAPAQPLERLELDDVVRRAVQTLQPLAQGRISLHLDGEPNCVTGSESELYEAVKNTLDNALKYAPDSPVRIRVLRQNGSAVVEIADEGPGMEPQDRAHAFDRFYRGSTRGETEGSGLGLAIAKVAVERAGGTAEIESEPGKGTRVRFLLPLSG